MLNRRLVGAKAEPGEQSRGDCKEPRWRRRINPNEAGQATGEAKKKGKELRVRQDRARQGRQRLSAWPEWN